MRLPGKTTLIKERYVFRSIMNCYNRLQSASRTAHTQADADLFQAVRVGAANMARAAHTKGITWDDGDMLFV